MDRVSKSLRTGLLLGIALLSSACSLLERHPDSGYASLRAFDYQNRDHLASERLRYEAELAQEELGLAASKALSDLEAKALENRLRLNQLESRLQTDREKRQYYQYKGAMLNDQERIQFLSLPTGEARERWATNRQLNNESEGHSEKIANLIEKNDVAIGMTPKAVIESWGDPDVVEVAGNKIYGNERWRYARYVPSNEGYQKQDRILYFEAGRLAGWETR